MGSSSVLKTRYIGGAVNTSRRDASGIVVVYFSGIVRVGTQEPESTFLYPSAGVSEGHPKTKRVRLHCTLEVERTA